MTDTLLLGAAHVVPYVAPLILILGLLALGRYPGERVLVAAARRARPARRRSPVRPARRRLIVLLPRGGALVGAALAGRAPPCPV